jgi:hypothetical protein
MIDLMNIARTEAASGDLFSLFQGMFEPADVRPEGYPDAVVWKGGNHDGAVNPVAHSLTDAYALIGTLAAIDVLGLPFYAVPMWSQYRHDTKLASLAWFGNMPCISIKWSTAGDAYVNDGKGNKVVVMGKSGNAPLRTQAGVYCNVRPYGTITNVRFMPGLPYSQDNKKFKVEKDTGNIHSEMNTPGVRMAYAARLFLQLVKDRGCIGRVATKPTQAKEDAVNAGLFRWLIQGTQFKLKRQYAVDAYEEHKENVDAIVALLPKDFKKGMETWGGDIYEHISDTNFGLLLHDMIEQRECVVY